MMKAVVFDGKLRLAKDYPVPDVPSGWARVKVHLTGICKTDMELMKGYMGYSGVLGHEFIGFVDKCEDKTWVGKRVVGEINASCGKCDMCDRGLGRHCSNRSTLGIMNLNGCMAEYCILPIANLKEVPESISDDRAVFTEPLSAACEILEQLKPAKCKSAVVLGDGRLGILCAWVLSTVLGDVTLVGHHPQKIRLARWRKLKTITNIARVQSEANIVVDATGTANGIKQAMELCAPRGHIVLKSTVAENSNIDMNPLVINEQTIVGSRCGQFKDGLKMLESYPDMPIERLITARYPMHVAVAAFKRASQSDALKVLLEL